MELAELHRTIHGRTAEREVASGEMYRKTKKTRIWQEATYGKACATLPLCTARSRLRETWPPMRLALARRASVPQPPGRATGLPGAALLARCTAQSCDNKGRLLSLSVEQCSCGRSWAAVQW